MEQHKQPDIAPKNNEKGYLEQLRILYHQAEDQIDRIDALYQNAEDQIKLVEQEEHKLALPCVNELRYAGQHLLKALAGGLDESETLEELKRAERHCKRSFYDAIEIRILKILSDTAIFQEDYRKIPITPVIGNYPELRKKLNQAKAAIDQIDKKDRHDHCEEIEQHLNELTAISETFENAREELNKAARIERRNVLRWLTGIVIAVLSIATTVLVAFLF